MRAERLKLLLGAEIDNAEVSAIFERLGMAVEAQEDGWSVSPPSARFDIEREVDLIEEVARIHGYDNIPETVGEMPGDLGTATEESVPLHRARLALVERGYQEAVTWSFNDPELDVAFSGGTAGLPLANPISSALSVMRQSLLPGLVQAALHNQQRQQARVRLFETGVRFVREGDGDGIQENLVIAGIALGDRLPEQWGSEPAPIDLFDLKSDIAALMSLAEGHKRSVLRRRDTPHCIPAAAPGFSMASGPWAGLVHCTPPWKKLWI